MNYYEDTGINLLNSLLQQVGQAQGGAFGPSPAPANDFAQFIPDYLQINTPPVDAMLLLEQAIRQQAGAQGSPQATAQTDKPPPAIPAWNTPVAPPVDLPLELMLAEKNAAVSSAPGKPWVEAAPGIMKSERTSKGGSTSYTNVSDAQGAPTMEAYNPATHKINPASYPVNPEATMLGANFSTRLQQIMKAEGSQAKISELSNLEAEAAQAASAIETGVREQMQRKYRVKELEAAVQVQQTADRRRPDYNLNPGDSQNTLRARQTLMQAQQQAESESQQAMRSNFKLNALQNQMKIARDVVSKSDAREAKQEDMTNQKKLQAELNQENMKAQEQIRLGAKAEQEGIKQEAKRAEILAKTTVESRDRMRLLVPSLKNATDEEIASKLVANKVALSEATFALTTDTPDVLMSKVLGGNAEAATVLAAEEERRTKRPMADNLRTLQNAKLETDPARLKQIALDVFKSIDSEGYKAVIPAINKLQSGIGTAQELAAAGEVRNALMRQHMATAAQTAWTGNLASNNWQIRNEGIRTVVDRIAKSGAPATLDAVARELIGPLPPGQRAQAVEMLREEIYFNADKFKGSLLFNINPDTAFRQVQLEATRGLLHNASVMANSWNKTLTQTTQPWTSLFGSP